MESQRGQNAAVETDVQGRTMAGAVSENAPRPVSVVNVDGVTVKPHPQQNEQNEQQQRRQNDENVTGACVPTTDIQVHQQQQQNHQRDENQQQRVADCREQEQQQQQSASRTMRSFASTEAQTEVPIAPRILESASHHHHHQHGAPQHEQHQANEQQLRDARRRERRVRRHHRRAMRSCSMPPTYPGVVSPGGCVGAVGGAGPVGGPAGMPLVPPVGGFLHPPPPHLGLRGLSLGLPFPVPGSVSAFGRSGLTYYLLFYSY